MDQKKLQELRQNYTLKELNLYDLDKDPFIQFTNWITEAISAEIMEPNAFVLSTVNKNLQPSSRVVLMKGFDETGLIFYTNYLSQKGLEIEENAKVAANFLWKPLQRQIRLVGNASKISSVLSETYFRSRPKKSQIAAWVSKQSQILDHRKTIEDSFAIVAKKYANSASLPCPPDWGGFVINPTSFEFWQGRKSRLHDRFRYTKSKQHWRIERLSP